MGVPISNAKNRKLTQQTGTLPNLGDALFNWFQPMSFVLLTKQVIGFQNVESAQTLDFQGVWQPFTARQLMMKPEGQRSWKWYTVHADPSLNLQTDDIIIYLDVSFRVMEKWDWNIYGYKEYHIIEDYNAAVSKLLTEDGDPITTEGDDPIII